LMTLDFPTLDRPRKAISGSVGAGNWPTWVAAVMNRERTRTLKFGISGKKLQALPRRSN
jgi:hypothetical protein